MWTCLKCGEEGEADFCPPCPPGIIDCPMMLMPCYLGTCPEDCP